MMNPNMQAGAMLGQRQQPPPPPQFQMQHVPHQAAALMNPMSVAMAMGQPAQASVAAPNGFGLHQHEPTASQLPAAQVDTASTEQRIEPVNVDSKTSAEVRHVMKSLRCIGADKSPEDEPVTPSAVETALMGLVDPSTLALVSPAKVKRFVNVLHGAKSEPEQALVLVILRATATSSDAKLAQSCASAFELSGGLKAAKQWLEAAVTWNYSDLLVLLLEVLKRIPLQLTSITEARINEPIVKLRKGAREERVKRAAQELLKYWRAKFTEKEKPAPTTATTATTSASASPAAPASVSASSTSTSTTGNGNGVATTKAGSPRASAASASASAGGSSSSSSAATTATTASSSPPKVSKLVGKLVKRRPIKRLERLPFGGGSAVSKSSSGSELIGNLMQRKAKEAAAAASESSSPRDADSGDASAAAAAEETKEGGGAASDVPMELPTIQSFKAAVSVPTAAKSSKRIRWADDSGQELVKVKLIESWRDLVALSPPDEHSFRDAKLREHADERNAIKAHKDPARTAFALALAHGWRAPAFVQLPEALAARRRRPLQTDEMHAQASRTRREMEYLVLDGEVPPATPKEWVRAPNDGVRGAPFEIPLSDVADAPPMAAAGPGPDMSVGPPSLAPGGFDAYESEDDRALREALGPLSKATLSALLETEAALPQVFDEAQRNGNRIPDARVLEIVDFHRRARLGFGGGPPGSKYGGHREPPSMYSSRFGGYDGPPPPMNPGAPFGAGGGFGKKRKAPAGAFGEAPPPPKRTSKRPCLFFNTARGCKNGAACAFLHEPPSGTTPGHVGPPGLGRYGQPPAHDMGGRGGHMAFRGGR